MRERGREKLVLQKCYICNVKIDVRILKGEILLLKTDYIIIDISIYDG